MNAIFTQRAARGLAAFAVASGLAAAAAGCAARPSHPASRSHLAGAVQHARAATRPHTIAKVSLSSTRETKPGTSVPSYVPPDPSYRGPHFSTPQAAMRFLAAAYNHHNAAELHWVTTPASYARLMGMRSEAVNLRLRYCTLNRRRGDYTCHFRHDYLPSLHKTGHGAATFIAAPALTPGWYMFTFVECG